MDSAENLPAQRNLYSYNRVSLEINLTLKRIHSATYAAGTRSSTRESDEYNRINDKFTKSTYPITFHSKNESRRFRRAMRPRAAAVDFTAIKITTRDNAIIGPIGLAFIRREIQFISDHPVVVIHLRRPSRRLTVVPPIYQLTFHARLSLNP